MLSDLQVTSLLNLGLPVVKRAKMIEMIFFGAFKEVFRCNQDILMMLELSKKIEYHDNIGT